jgi:nucleoid-associated protein YgaU
MSVLSAAETGSSPDIPRRRLRVATPVAGQDDGGPAAGALGAETTEEPDPAAWVTDGGRPPLGATELHATELRVREIRVVREASVRTLRASGSQPTAAQARHAAARAPGAQAWAAAASARSAAGPGAATQTRVVTHGRATYVRAAHVRATRTRTGSQRPRRPGAVRLTRRGRIVVAGFAMLVVVVAATVLWMTVAGSVQAASRGGPAPRSPYQGMTQVVVQPGQTLWSIAAAAEPSANTWTVVQQITEVNALNGAVLRAGQLLWVPKG